MTHALYRNALYFSSSSLELYNGPWCVINPGDPAGPSGENVLCSTDPGSVTVIPLNGEYEAYSDSYISITGAATSQIDGGGIKMHTRAQACRMTGETLDEFRLGVYFHDGANALIAGYLSDEIGTDDGLLTATWVTFLRTFAIPVGTRKFRFRISAIKRNEANNHAHLQFINTQAVAFEPQLTPFAETHATITDLVIRDYWGLTEGQINTSSMSRLKIDNLGRAGYYNPSPGNKTRLEWAREFLSDILAVPSYGDPEGRFGVSQIRNAPALHDILEHHISGPISSLESPTRHKVRTLEYARNYTLQNADTLAGAVDDETLAFVTLEYRAIREAAAGMADALGAIESKSPTYFYDLEGAQVEALRQLELLSPQKSLWKIPIEGFQLKIKICDVARITYPRFRFGTTRAGIVLYVLEEGKEQRSTIYWWG